MMVRKMTSTPCQSYLTVVFLLVIIAVQCTCNLLEDLDMERYDQDYKRQGACRSCTTLACARICALGKRSFTLDKGPESQDKFVPRIQSDSCLLDSFFRSLSEEGKERIIKAFLESE